MDIVALAQETMAKVAVSKTVHAVFKNNLINARHALANGKNCFFLNGKFTTNSEDEIKELMAEVAAGHPHIYLDPEELVMDTKFIDPLEAVRKQIMDELRAKGQLIEAGASDFGTSEETKLNIATTRDVAEAMSGSTSADGGGAGTARVIVAGPKA